MNASSFSRNKSHHWLKGVIIGKQNFDVRRTAVSGACPLHLFETYAPYISRLCSRSPTLILPMNGFAEAADFLPHEVGALVSSILMSTKLTT
jgi:hypothetical protein